MSKGLEALMTFSYIMTRCQEEDSYIIKFPLGVVEGTTFGEQMQSAYNTIKKELQELEDYRKVMVTPIQQLIEELKQAELNKEILDILKNSPFVLQKFFELKELKNQDEYNKRYFWGTIDVDAWAKVRKWIEKDDKKISWEE